jgi:hypothetical protein
MSKIKTESRKNELLREMNVERTRFVRAGVVRTEHSHRARGVSSAEGALLNALFSVATGGRFPAFLRKPVQGFALAWLKGRFDKIVAGSLHPAPARPKAALFDEGLSHTDASGAPVPTQVQSVNDLRRASNALNLAIKEGTTEEIQKCSEALKAQIAMTRIALDNANAGMTTAPDRAVGWMLRAANRQPWLAIGASLVAGFGAATVWSQLSRWQNAQQARKAEVAYLELERAHAKVLEQQRRYRGKVRRPIYS